jgi:hypothetical protein
MLASIGSCFEVLNHLIEGEEGSMLRRPMHPFSYVCILYFVKRMIERKNQTVIKYAEFILSLAMIIILTELTIFIGGAKF